MKEEELILITKIIFPFFLIGCWIFFNWVDELKGDK